MATSDQLKSLVKSHIEGDDRRFFSIAMQIAAHEARIGHEQLAKDLRDLIDSVKTQRKSFRRDRGINVSKSQEDLSPFFTASYPKVKFSDMILEPELHSRLVRIMKEQRQIVKLGAYGLTPRRKLLLLGPPGTGKTMTASALAGELSLPLFVIRLERVITRYMGETSAKLGMIFDALAQNKGIYLFDEFDSIGSMRETTNDVGEMRRILNSFLQFIDADDSDSLILAATNHPDILDYALFRRYDDVIEYHLPKKSDRIQLMQNKLAAFPRKDLNWDDLAEAAAELSFGEITRACEDALKDTIIHDRDTVTNQILLAMLAERQLFRPRQSNQPKES